MIPPNRIYHLDVLRGLAILGILIMNLPEFALPSWKSYNACWVDAPHSLNFRIWEVIFIFFEGKMRGILSVMFGVSILLFTQKKQEESGISMADAYFRRMFWLLFICIFSSFVLVSSTTILYEYSICGILLFVVRNNNYKWLLSLGIVLLLVYSVRQGNNFVNTKELAVNYYSAIERKDHGTKLDSADIKAIKVWNDRQTGLVKEIKDLSGGIITEMRTYHSGYTEIVARQAEELSEGFSGFGISDLLETLGTVLLGMALFKTKFLRAELKANTYLVLGLALLCTGSVIGYFRMRGYVMGTSDVTGKNLLIRQFSAGHTEQFHRLSFVFGYISLFIFFCKTNFFKMLLYPSECVGKMAISNYVFQNFTCTLIFYGYGLDLYNALQRWQLLLVMAAIWIVQITFSILWLRYFRMGPLEWCWRSLIYRKRQPLRIVGASA
jgi:uncharacterized protein